jgi:hypothetical protein
MATSRDDIRREGKLILNESEGNVIPIKVPNTIPKIVVIITFAFSFVLRGAPLQN